jgi:hypothetical protein
MIDLRSITCSLTAWPRRPATPCFRRSSHALRVSETQFAEQGLCNRCWRELFGEVEDSDAWVQRRARVGERQMKRARAMIEREGWGRGRSATEKNADYFCSPGGCCEHW